MTTQTFELQAVTDEELLAAAGGSPLPFLLVVGLVGNSKKADHIRELAHHGQLPQCIDGAPSKACRRQGGITNQAFS